MNEVIDRAITLIGDEPAERFSLAPAANATPADLLRIAVNSGAGIEIMERLMALQIKWEEREAQKLYNVAFAKFKAEAIVVVKNKTVAQGPLAGGKYAELHSVVNAVTPALSRHGLSTSWRLTKDDKDWIEVTCTLKHEAGYSESVSMGGPPDAGGAKSALQARASTQTFLERYTLKAILGVAEQGDDNDGGNTGDEGSDELLQSFRDAAMEGAKALENLYRSKKPTPGFWAKHSRALKEAARQADAGVAK